MGCLSVEVTFVHDLGGVLWRRVQVVVALLDRVSDGLLKLWRQLEVGW